MKKCLKLPKWSTKSIKNTKPRCLNCPNMWVLMNQKTECASEDKWNNFRTNSRTALCFCKKTTNNWPQRRSLNLGEPNTKPFTRRLWSKWLQISQIWPKLWQITVLIKMNTLQLLSLTFSWIRAVSRFPRKTTNRLFFWIDFRAFSSFLTIRRVAWANRCLTRFARHTDLRTQPKLNWKPLTIWVQTRNSWRNSLWCSWQSCTTNMAWLIPICANLPRLLSTRESQEIPTLQTNSSKFWILTSLLGTLQKKLLRIWAPQNGKRSRKKRTRRPIIELFGRRNLDSCLNCPKFVD